uniref:Uncharacterized protein n=1 Tax=Trypanosoma congolense (strain IL3000) TaxID=1068625 RepID=G0UL34_TRYCI|nr:hypothetical protein, unlikely [Trypanosoma congolense IL3000]
MGRTDEPLTKIKKKRRGANKELEAATRAGKATFSTHKDARINPQTKGKRNINIKAEKKWIQRHRGAISDIGFDCNSMHRTHGSCTSRSTTITEIIRNTTDTWRLQPRLLR